MPELKIPYTTLKEKYEDNKGAFILVGIFTLMIILVMIVAGIIKKDFNVVIGNVVVLGIVFVFIMASIVRLTYKIKIDDTTLTFNVFGIMGTSYYKRRVTLEKIRSFEIKESTLIIHKPFGNKF